MRCRPNATFLRGCVGSSNLSFFSEIRAAGRAALDLFRERADAVLELNIAINSLEVHVTPRSVNDAEAAATAWEAAAEAASVQPAMVDDKLLALFLERTNITLAASTATFDIYEPFETESDRGPKLAVEELFVDRMRFRCACLVAPCPCRRMYRCLLVADGCRHDVPLWLVNLELCYNVEESLPVLCTRAHFDGARTEMQSHAPT